MCVFGGLLGLGLRALTSLGVAWRAEPCWLTQRRSFFRRYTVALRVRRGVGSPAPPAAGSEHQDPPTAPQPQAPPTAPGSAHSPQHQRFFSFI